MLDRRDHAPERSPAARLRRRGRWRGPAEARAPQASRRRRARPALRHDALHRLQGLRRRLPRGQRPAAGRAPRARPALWDTPSTSRARRKNIIKLYRNGTDGQGLRGRSLLQGAVHALRRSGVRRRPACSARSRSPNTASSRYDADHCVGCRYCRSACPFNVPKFQCERRPEDRQVRAVPPPPAARASTPPAPRSARPAPRSMASAARAEEVSSRGARRSLRARRRATRAAGSAAPTLRGQRRASTSTGLRRAPTAAARRCSTSRTCRSRSSACPTLGADVAAGEHLGDRSSTASTRASSRRSASLDAVLAGASRNAPQPEDEPRGATARRGT